MEEHELQKALAKMYLLFVFVSATPFGEAVWM